MLRRVIAFKILFIRRKRNKKSMGVPFSKAQKRNPTEEKSVSGLLPTAGLEAQNFDIENLVFASCGAEGVSYAGAVRLLEKLGILKNIKRFCGVGTGAIYATLLAIGLDSKEVQVAFHEHLVNVQIDDDSGYENLSEGYIEDFGWNYGLQTSYWFDDILESKSFESDVTFRDFYKETATELCLVVTNVDNMALEYCHPKTTPDLTIKQALFMAISTPGIFNPQTYIMSDERCYYVNGAVICSYPIHCFDGWLLSMDEENSLLNKLEDPTDFFTAQAFDSKNPKTLGFFPIDKRQENRYNDFVVRLQSMNADLRVPRTTLGLKYKTNIQKQTALVHKFTLLQNACRTLFSTAANLKNDHGNIPVEPFAKTVFADKSFTKSDRLLFPEIGKNLQSLTTFLYALSESESTLPPEIFDLFIQIKLLSLLNEYTSYNKDDIVDLPSYFGAVFDASASTTIDLPESDYDRTVGILCRHIGPQDLDFRNDDQTFLFRQGWNATVAFLRNVAKHSDSEQQTEIPEQD